MRNSYDMPRSTETDGCLTAFAVGWVIAAILTIAFWGVVAWGIISVVNHVTSNCYSETGAQIECPQ